MTISYKKLKYAAVIYAALQITVFFFGWLSPVWAVIMTAVMYAACVISFRKHTDCDGQYNKLEISGKSLAVLAVISFLWCFLGGQGGFFYQTGDHAIRNIIISDLTLRDWPVTYHNDSNMMCYYICYWMIPCGAGRIVHKLSGDATFALHISNIMLLLQSTIGCFITLLLAALITQPKKKAMPVASALMFILFSGLDVLGDRFTNVDGQPLNHIEWWAAYFQFSSINTGVFWVYNQTIPVWPIILCLINEKKCKDFAFLAMLAFPFAPFPFVGMFIFCVTKAVFIFIDSSRNKALKEELVRTISPQNFMMCLSVFVVFALYFTSSVLLESGGSEHNTGLRLHHILTDPEYRYLMGDLLIKYAVFMIIEVLVFSVILFIKDKENRKMLTATTIALFVIPLVQLGYQYDFGMRVSIPGLVFIGILFIRYILENASQYEKFELERIIKKNPVFLAACMIFVLGAGTPVIEFATSIKRTVSIAASDRGEIYGFDYVHIYSFENDSNQTGNFFSQNYKGSPFYRIFMRKDS